MRSAEILRCRACTRPGSTEGLVVLKATWSVESSHHTYWCSKNTGYVRKAGRMILPEQCNSMESFVLARLAVSSVLEMSSICFLEKVLCYERSRDLSVVVLCSWRDFETWILNSVVGIEQTIACLSVFEAPKWGKIYLRPSKRCTFVVFSRVRSCPEVALYLLKIFRSVAFLYHCNFLVDSGEAHFVFQSRQGISKLVSPKLGGNEGPRDLYLFDFYRPEQGEGL